MDTIKKHAKKLKQPYQQSANTEEIVASAIALARLVLDSTALLRKHKKKILSDVQWLISEVDGKHTTRYRSSEVVRLAKECPDSECKIQHEHVFARKFISELILDYPEEFKEILGNLRACVVTKAEHDRLRGTAKGWRRYINAGIAVLDMAKDPPKPHDLSMDEPTGRLFTSVNPA